jgi:multiple antibiotic resistance protein
MASSLLSSTLLAFGSIFSIVDPFAALPVFLALVGESPKVVQQRTALRASATCLFVLLAFALFGSFIFHFFGITIPAFKIAGGILLFGVGLEMMRAEKSKTRATPEEEHEAERKEDVGLIPLGLPLLSGPGAIATVMVLIGQAKSSEKRLAVYLSIGVVAVVTFLVLRSASYFARALGQTGINVITRIMGLILAAMAIQFVLEGAREAFPFLSAAPAGRG